MTQEQMNAELFKVIKLNDFSNFQKLLNTGADANVTDANGNTPLYIACLFLQVDIKFVNLLLEKGADPNLENNNQETPLIKAIETRNLEKAIRVAESISGGVNNVNSIGDSPIHISSLYGAYKITEQLLLKKANVDTRDSENNTSLHIALDRCRFDSPDQNYSNTVKLLLEHKADVNAINIYNETALDLAVKSGNINVVKMILDAGADINLSTVNRDGDSLLHAAIKNDKIKIVELLLKNGARIDIKNSKGQTPLEAAEANNNKEIANLIHNAEHENSKKNLKKIVTKGGNSLAIEAFKSALNHHFASVSPTTPKKEKPKKRRKLNP